LTPLAAWADDIRPKLRGLTNALVVDAVRDACIEFCRDSRIWSYPTTISLVGGTHTYSIPTDTSSAAVGIISAILDGRTEYLEEQDTRFFDLYLSDWRTTPGDVRYFYRPSYTQVRFVRTPSSAATVNVDVALRPPLTATEVPDFLFFEYSRQIATGAMAELRAMKDKPWSDPAQAREDRSDFISHIHAAAVNRGRGLTRRPLRTKTYR
jgi:hypothetical protein